MEKRYYQIDLLKTIAMFYVVVIHCFNMEIDFWETGNISNYMVYFFRTILSMSVPVFLFCNGFLLFGKGLNLKKHIQKIVKFTFLTYFWAVVTIVVTVWISGKAISVNEGINIIREWRLGWVNHLWFMGALVRIYIVFPIVKLAVERKKEILIYLTIVLAILVLLEKGLGILGVVEPGNEWLRSFAQFNPFRASEDWTYFYFCLGGIFYIYREKIQDYIGCNRKKWNLLCGIIILVNCIVLFFFGVWISKLIMGHWDVVWLGYDMPFTMCSVVCLFIISLNYKLGREHMVGKVINAISKNTLGIYFIHMIFVNLWGVTCEKFISCDSVGGILVCSIVVLTITTISTMFMKKIPVTRWLVG